MSDQPYPPGLAAVFEVVRRLRAPDGCPWDKEQTHESLRPYLLEETYELLEAIDSGDEARIREELGDVLLQVAMHAQIAADEGRFDAAAISEQEVFQEFGDLLFALVNVARKRRVNPEDALRAAGQRFVRRFKAMEAIAAQRGIDLGRLDEAALEALWAESA